MSEQTNDGTTEHAFENVLYAVRGPLALITINRPEKHNAISLATLDDLHAAVDQAAYDDAVRVIAITGAGGKAFAAGSDLSEVINRDFKKALEPIVQGLADKLERTPKPTIAAIDGICMGGGWKSHWAAIYGSRRRSRASRPRKASWALFQAAARRLVYLGWWVVAGVWK